MKFSILALSFLAVSQAFVPTAHHRPRAFALKTSTQDAASQSSTFTESAAVYESNAKTELDKATASAFPLIEGSEFEDIPMTGDPMSKVVHKVRAPLKDVWELARPFGGSDVTKWWKIYKDDKMELDGPDAVGVERKFVVGPRTTHEMLAERDDENHRFVYKITDSKGYPTGYYGTTTEVSMKKIDDETTEVTWQSWSRVHRLIQEAVGKGQERAYLGAISSLDAYFNRAVGTLDVNVMSAEGLEGTPYVVVKIDDNVPKDTSKVKGDNPVYDEKLSFDMYSKEGRAYISVRDSKRRKDEVLGSTFVDLSTIETGSPTVLTLPLKGGPAGATITASFNIKFDDYKEEVHAELHGAPKDEDDGFSLDKIKFLLQDLGNKAFDAMIVYNMGKQATIEYDRYSRSPKLDHVPLENLPRSAKGLPFQQQLKPDKIGLIVQRLVEYAYSQVSFPIKMQTNEFKFQDKWLSFWSKEGDGYLMETANTENIKKNYPKDEEQARQYLNGMSPTMVSQVKSLNQIKDIPLKNVKLGGEDLQSIIDRKGLFYCDYKYLAPLEQYKNMVFYAPYVLMYKPKGSEEMKVGAIQLDRTRNAVVYTDNKEETSDSRWKFARLHLSCADNQYHQFIFHLGYGHLAMEPHIVSIYNSFPDDHIIKKLMTPHFKDTIGINFLARQTLVSEVEPITDRTFSPGTAQAMQLFLEAWDEYDFFDNNFVNDLKNRGFDEEQTDGVKDYYYREDGFKLWNAMGNYIEKVVDASYPNDKDVENDEHIKKWAHETSAADRADIPGFPKRIYSKVLLVKSLQTIMWNLSAAHSAVNFSQYDHLSYIPNRPNALFKRMPKGSPKEEIPDFGKFWEDSLPPIESIGHFEVLFSWLLTTPPQVTLEKVDAMKGAVPGAYELFQKELNALHLDIKSRNDDLAKKGKPNYPYLDPHRVEASIAI